MNIKEYLKKIAKQVDAELDRYLPPSGKNPRIIHRAIRYSVFSGGKRLRPILAIEAARACGGRMADVMPTACALELIHAYSLVHDDLPPMDNDDYRRGKPALHKKFDEAVAILAGDALLSLSFNLMVKGSSPSVQRLVVEETSKAIGTFGMIGGQVMDIKIKKKNPAVLNYIHAHKTAALIEAAAKVGAIVAGAGKNKIKALAGFGRFFGLSFQIIDDILDKDDYYASFGEAEARRRAGVMAGKAEASLKPFEKKADRLREITRYMLSRKR